MIHQIDGLGERIPNHIYFLFSNHYDVTYDVISDYDVIQIFKKLLKIELLADLDDQYIKLTGMMRGFQNMLTFCIPTSVTSSMTSQSFWVAFYIRSILMTS